MPEAPVGAGGTAIDVVAGGAGAGPAPGWPSRTSARGIAIRREQLLSFDDEGASFRYAVLSERDVSERWGATAVPFDAVDGRLRGRRAPTGADAGTAATELDRRRCTRRRSGFQR